MNWKANRKQSRLTYAEVLYQVTRTDPNTGIKYGLQFCKYKYPFNRAFKAYRVVIFRNDGSTYMTKAQTPMPLDVLKSLVIDMEMKERMGIDADLKLVPPAGSVSEYLKALNIKAAQCTRARVSKNKNENKESDNTLEDWEK